MTTDERASLVERMAERMWYASLDHFNATDAPVGFTDWADAAESADLMRAEAEAALAAVEAAGWGPKPEGHVTIERERWERVRVAARSSDWAHELQIGDLDAEP